MKYRYQTPALMLLVLVFVMGCTQTASPEGDTMKNTRMIPEEVTFQTNDGVRIYGTYFAGTEHAVVLLHMLGETRQSWRSFAEELAATGMSVLSIDLRGHGQSTFQNGNARPVSQFSPREYQLMPLDVIAATTFLREREKTEISLVGASIGANVASNIAPTEQIMSLVLLSPGIDYRGVRTQPYVQAFSGPVLIVVSEEDTQSYGATQALAQSRELDLKTYQGAGHGTDMLTNSAIKTTVLEWIKEHG